MSSSISHPSLQSQAEPVPPPSAWKTEVTARVRAHRNRGGRTSVNQPTLPGLEPALSPVAARVAQRYARLPSYREVLAAQAAAAQSAADALAAAVSAPPADATEPPPNSTVPYSFASDPAEPEPEPYQPALIHYTVSSDSLPEPRTTPTQARAEVPSLSAAHFAADFTDPLDEALVEPTQPLPARLLSSPRELVAPRKARPRLAEGPLLVPGGTPPFCSTSPRDEPWVAGDRQHVSNSPGRAPLPIPNAGREAAPPMPNRATPPPDWLSIHLDTEPSASGAKSGSSADGSPRLHVASLEDRSLAALVDCALTLSAFLLFAVVFALCTTSLPNGRVALLGTGATLFAMWLLYQLLFFTLTNATPGMRYAKIALCTFSDENPSRSALRGRIAAVLLSALPLGLGFLWAVFDEDALGWHDRITQTYQRSYRGI